MGRAQRVLTSIASYRLITNDVGRSLQMTARRPDVARETSYYLANIGKVKTVEEFIGDHRLFDYAMRAFGLADLIYAKAFIKKVLTEGIDNPNSIANKLTDPRFREFVATFNFARYGELATSLERAQQGVVDKYVRQVLEEGAGQQNEGVRLALYFQRKAPELSNAYQILADRALSEVVRTALGLPPLTAAIDVDRQAQMIEQRINFDDFKNPAKLESFITRFLSLWELANPSTYSNPANLLIGRPIEAGFAPELLASFQNLRFARL